MDDTCGVRKDLWQRLGIFLIAMGVGVWALYGLFRYGMGWHVSPRQFLPYHLAGVVPGVVFRRHGFFKQILARFKVRMRKE